MLNENLTTIERVREISKSVFMVCVVVLLFVICTILSKNTQNTSQVANINNKDVPVGEIKVGAGNILSLMTDDPIPRQISSTNVSATKTALDVTDPNGSQGAPLDNVTDLAIATSSSGSLATGTYYFVVTSIDGNGGETLQSSEVECGPIGESLTGSPNGCTATLTVNPLAASTRLWVATTTGVYYGYVSATSSTFVGALTSLTSATIPTVNTAFDIITIAKYEETAPTLTNGQFYSLLLDILGNVKVTLATALDYVNDSITTHEKAYSYNYVAAPAANTVVKSTSGKLVRIILGAWVTGGTVECSDHASDGDGNVKIFLTMGATDESGLPKSVEIGANFATGITCDTIGATQVTFIYE